MLILISIKYTAYAGDLSNENCFDILPTKEQNCRGLSAQICCHPENSSRPAGLTGGNSPGSHIQLVWHDGLLGGYRLLRFKL